MKQKENKIQETFKIRKDRLEDFGFKDYSSFLKSQYWADVKHKCSRRKRFKKCQYCNSTDNIELHHKTYKFLGTKDELMGLIALCRKHHQIIHDKTQDTKEAVRIVTNRLFRLGSI